MSNADWLDRPLFRPVETPAATVATAATRLDPTPPTPPRDWNPSWRDWAIVGLFAVLWFQTLRGCGRDNNPTPGPNVSKLRVLILEESADRAALPFDQQLIFNAVEIREAITKAGGELLVLDKDDATAKLSREWQSIRERITLPPPCVVIATRRGATEFALPAEVSAMVRKIEGAAK